MNKVNLKFCPLCGNEVELLKNGNYYSIICQNKKCGCSINFYNSKEKIINVWNERNSKLKNCPLCDSKVNLSILINKICIECNNCNCRVTGKTKEEIIKKWNNRKGKKKWIFG